MAQKEHLPHEDALWYKDAVIYQLHVKTFFDSDGDGIGDFPGLTQKLDYLKALGINAIWLLPFYPSPLKDDGYDIADYYNIHPHYGTLNDFKEFLKEAHKRDLKVITELVINHTSDQHQWFKRARAAKKDSAERDFYVWSDSPNKYKDARIIFKDFETSNWCLDPVADAHYWHRFYKHQPDLNFDNPQVQEEILKVLDFWFRLGVDGMRLDAVPYLFEREGTNCENLPETYAYLKKLRSYVDKHFKNKMLLAEANQWPEDAVAYFGDGDECHMAFHFPLMPRMYMALRMEDRYPIIDILEQTPAIAENCQWAIFLRNHDELTLEMVTDEERDYMYRAFAADARMKINMGIRRRLIPLLDNDRKRIELMNILLFSLTGSPIIYYGDEIGMGDNYYLGDRDGVRTPMQWSPDRNAGFSKANPQRLYLPVIIDPQFHYETVNVETQERNLSSLLWWMRRVIDNRKKFKAFSRGSIEFLYPDNPKVLSFIREYQDQKILVVINLSRFSQVVTLDLSKYKGFVPREVFSSNDFPRIKDNHYTITLGPHGHYWLLLRDAGKFVSLVQKEHPFCFEVTDSWEEVLSGKNAERLCREIFPPYLQRCRWFGGKSKIIQLIRISHDLPLTVGGRKIHLLTVEVRFKEGFSTNYVLPLCFLNGDGAATIIKDQPQSVVAHVKIDKKHQEGIIYDGVYNKDFHEFLFDTIVQGKTYADPAEWEIAGYPGKKGKSHFKKYRTKLSSEVLKSEQSNTAIVIDKKYFLKLFRRLEEGINPDTEIVKYLTEENQYGNVPDFLGSIEYHRPKAEAAAVCILQDYVQNQGDAWQFSLDQLKGYYERVLARKEEKLTAVRLPAALLDTTVETIPPLMSRHIGNFYLEMTKLLGQRTAELHRIFASDQENPAFTPEPFSMLYQRAIYQTMRCCANKVFEDLKRKLPDLKTEEKREAKLLLGRSKEIHQSLKLILQKKFDVVKIRIHGDFHLGQVLYTGKDFMILDFEGEPTRSLTERKLKRCVLRDVASMLRSFHYAAYGALFLNSSIFTDNAKFLQPWADRWYHCVSSVYLQSYLNTLGESSLVPKERRDLETMLHVYLLEKAIYELGYELNNRPLWAGVPLRAIKYILSDIKKIK